MSPENKILSVIIPAHNEEAFIAECITSIKESFINLPREARIELEILVVLNRCTDSTEEIIKQFGCKSIENEDQNLSKIRNAGVAAAKGELIITVDADSLVSKNLLPRVYKHLNNPKIIGGGVMIYPERWSLGIALTGFGLLWLTIFYRITAGAFYFRKSEFVKIGGFNEDWLSAEDVEFARRLKKFGKKSGRKYKNDFLAYIVTSCRKFDHFGDWYFLKRPILVFKLLGNKAKEEAKEIWYNFND